MPSEQPFELPKNLDVSKGLYYKSQLIRSMKSYVGQCYGYDKTGNYEVLVHDTGYQATAEMAIDAINEWLDEHNLTAELS